MRREWIAAAVAATIICGAKAPGTARTLPEQPPAAAADAAPGLMDFLVGFTMGDTNLASGAVDEMPSDSRGELIPDPPPEPPPSAAPAPGSTAPKPPETPKPSADEPKPDANVQNEDVVPIAGDSSGPTDEIMNDARASAPRWFLAGAPAAHAAAVGWAAPAAPRAAAVLTRTVTFFTGLRDGSMEMTVASAEALTAGQVKRLMTRQLLLTPVDPASRKELSKSMASVMKRGSGAHVRRFKLAAYCVEAQKGEPVADTMFVPADRAARAQFASMRLVRRVGENAAQIGALKPQGDWNAYGRFVTQYAIWTKLEHWDQTRFADEFLARSKASVKAQHKTWTPAIEDSLRASTANRWKDVRLVIDAADRVQAKLATAGGVR
jgi:hypothetical protein